MATTSLHVVIATIVTLATTQLLYISACPVQCQCHIINNTTHVTCVDQSLTGIPDGLPYDTVDLDLHGNQISSLTNVFQNLTKLQKLDLSFNRLESLQDSDFNGLQNLHQLNLQGNDIISLTNRTFDSLPNLEVLNLANNSIESINSAIFSELSYLQTLDIHSNQISKLLLDTFASLSALNSLDLSKNNIRELPLGVFRDLFQLQILDLHENDLQSLDGQYFPDMTILHSLDVSSNELSSISNLTTTKLVTLDLSWNNLTNITVDYFEHLVNLTSLTLDGNPIISIDKPVFKEMKNLQDLSLSWMSNLSYLSGVTFEGLENLTMLSIHNNPNLSFIHKNLFGSLSSISIIDLTYNNITTFYNQSIQDLSQLTALYLHGNALSCDCSVTWLVESIQSNDTIIQNVPLLDCIMPNSGLTVPIMEIQTHTLECSEVKIVNHSANSAFKIGQAVILHCVVESFPSAEITWTTPRNHTLEYHNFHEYATLDYLSLSDQKAIQNNREQSEPTSYYSQSESRQDRVRVLEDGSLFIDYVMRTDAGAYKCVAKNAGNETEIVIQVLLDYTSMTTMYLWSLVVGVGCAGAFFFLNVTYSTILFLVRRCISVRRRERIKQVLESMDQYKTAHLVSIKENYNHQVGRIRDQYHYQLGRLRENHQNRSQRMGRMREGASQKMEKLRENYNNQTTRLKDYSSNQMLQIREKYNNQVDKIKDYGSDKLERIHEKYKFKQQHVIKLLEMMNLDSCRTVFDSECVRTESMILQSDLFDVDHVHPIHSPIDSLSNSDDEYLTATSSESSKHASYENLTRNLDEAQNNGDDATAIDKAVSDSEDSYLEIETSFNAADSSKVNEVTSSPKRGNVNSENGACTSGDHKKCSTPDFSDNSFFLDEDETDHFQDSITDVSTPKKQKKRHKNKRKGKTMSKEREEFLPQSPWKVDSDKSQVDKLTQKQDEDNKAQPAKSGVHTISSRVTDDNGLGGSDTRHASDVIINVPSTDTSPDIRESIV